MRLVRDWKAKGYTLLATGEMGIGNTTTSSAVAAALLGQPVERMTGRGAGLSDAGLARKIDAIRRGIAVNRPKADDPLDVFGASWAGWISPDSAACFWAARSMAFRL